MRVCLLDSSSGVCAWVVCVCVWGGGGGSGGVRVWVCVCICVNVREVGLEGFVFCCNNLYDVFSFWLFITSFDVALISFLHSFSCPVQLLSFTS